MLMILYYNGNAIAIPIFNRPFAQFINKLYKSRFHFYPEPPGPSSLETILPVKRLSTREKLIFHSIRIMYRNHLSVTKISCTGKIQTAMRCIGRQ
jgi:hypothetical protein